nr:MAG TPA_asm: hypothetical protein [Caudoviricetes sp.]
MPTPTYTPLANITLSSSASSVTFSNIPNTYRDLILVATPASSDGGTNRYMGITFNSDTTGSNYSNVAMMGNGSVTGSSTFTGGIFPQYYSDLSGTVGNNVITLSLMDYSATDKHKTVLSRSSRGDFGVTATAHRWASTSAISTIVVSCVNASWKSGSTFALYGVIA